MNLSPNLPCDTALVQGIKVSIPVLLSSEDLAPVAETLAAVNLTPAVAAAMISQTFIENVVNGVSKSVKELIAKVLSDQGVSWDGKLSSLDEGQKQAVYSSLDREAVQEVVNTFIAGYVPGVRRASTSSAETLDPVDIRATEIAREDVLAKLSETSFSFEGVSYAGIGRTMKAASFKAFDKFCQSNYERTAQEMIAAKAAELVESDPHYRSEARRQIEARTSARIGISFEL